MAKEDPYKSEETWFNLVTNYFVEGEEPEPRGERDHGGYNRRENVPRDMEVKATHYDDKVKGQFMRLKNSDNLEYEQKLKEF